MSLQNLIAASEKVQAEVKANVNSNVNVNANTTHAKEGTDPNADSESKIKEENKKEVKIDDIDDDTLNKILEKRGIKVVREEKPETPEQKTKRIQDEKLDMIKFAVENLNMKVDDFTEFEKLDGKSDAELVYDGYAKNQKSKYKGIDDETIRRRFDNEYYHDEYADDSDKEWGLDRIKDEAATVRKNAKTPFEKVESEYRSYKEAEVVYNNAKKEAKKYLENVNKVFEVKVQDEIDNDGKRSFPKHTVILPPYGVSLKDINWVDLIAIQEDARGEWVSD